MGHKASAMAIYWQLRISNSVVTFWSSNPRRREHLYDRAQRRGFTSFGFLRRANKAVTKLRRLSLRILYGGEAEIESQSRHLSRLLVTEQNRRVQLSDKVTFGTLGSEPCSIALNNRCELVMHWSGLS
jgi:hypothetical protein